MTKFESRPSRAGLWDYVFFIDMEGHHDDANVATALAGCRSGLPLSKCLVLSASSAVKLLLSVQPGWSIRPAAAFWRVLMKSVCLFCGSNKGTRPEYVAAAAAFGRTLAEEGITLVYGAGKVGLMGVAADAALAAGGKVIGVIPEFLKAKEVAPWASRNCMSRKPCISARP
jgi:hypothetical protein